MTRALILLIFTFALPFCVQGQKLFKKTFDSSSAKEVQIDARFVYRVVLHTHNSEQIIVSARSEGEYGNDMVINLWQEAATVYIGTNFHPDYQPKNDKLSAHKVLSVELDVFLPSYFDVSLSGGSTNVVAEGLYESLEVNLESGRCELNEVTGLVQVTTLSGDIFLNGGKGILNAESEYGQTYSVQLDTGPSDYNLNSTKGDIKILSAK